MLPDQFFAQKHLMQTLVDRIPMAIAFFHRNLALCGFNPAWMGLNSDQAIFALPDVKAGEKTQRRLAAIGEET